MTALLNGPRLAVFASVGVALAYPAFLLWPGTQALPEAASFVVTRLAIAEPDPIDGALAAPLFNQERSPPDPSQPEQPALAEQAAAAPPPKLVGLIAGGRRPGVALLQTADGQTFSLRIGEEAGGWRLATVDAGGATVEQGSQQQRLELDYSNKTATSAGTGAPDGVSQPPIG